jgi:hypothetical protein
MVVIPSTGASRYRNLCKDGGTSSEYFGYTAVHVHIHTHTHLYLRFLRSPGYLDLIAEAGFEL